MQTQTPSLIENHVKFFLDRSLAQCHAYKEHMMNQLVNVVVGVFLVVVVGGYLYWNYKGPMDMETKRQQDYEEKMRVLTKIHSYDKQPLKSNTACSLSGQECMFELF